MRVRTQYNICYSTINCSIHKKTHVTWSLFLYFFFFRYVKTTFAAATGYWFGCKVRGESSRGLVTLFPIFCMIFYDLKQKMTNAAVHRRAWYYYVCIVANVNCSLPFLQLLFFSTSTRIQTRRPHKLRPFHPSTRRTRHPRWQGPVRWPHCWSLKCRPRQRIQQLD